MEFMSTKCSGNTRRRELYKATTPPWKETIRNRCYTKFQKARERLVDAFRELPTVAEMKRQTSRLMDSVMDQEWRELYAEMPEFRELDQRDISQLEEEIRRELKVEEEKQWEEHYLSLVRYEESEIEQMSDILDQVSCPVCKKNLLQEFNNGIICACGLQLFDTGEALTLTRFSKDLNEGLDHHSQRCDHTPTFNNEHQMYLAVKCWECRFEYNVPHRNPWKQPMTS